MFTVCRSVAAPAEGDKASVPAQAPEPTDLSAAIATITSSNKVYTEAKLPPAIPTAYRRWKPERAEDAPHDRTAYFPMLLFK